LQTGGKGFYWGPGKVGRALVVVLLGVTGSRTHKAKGNLARENGLERGEIGGQDVGGVPLLRNPRGGKGKGDGEGGGCKRIPRGKVVVLTRVEN